MATLPDLVPLNDWAATVTLKDVGSDGRPVPLETGTVTVFLAIANTPTATAADPSLSVAATYTGAGGKWLIQFDGATLTAALLATHFASTPPYLIIVQLGSIRTYATLTYAASRAAVIA